MHFQSPSLTKRLYFNVDRVIDHGILNLIVMNNKLTTNRSIDLSYNYIVWTSENSVVNKLMLTYIHVLLYNGIFYRQ